MPAMMNVLDRRILRELAQQVADAAAAPIMAERRELWRRHSRMLPSRPAVYIDPQGSWCELVPDSALRCESVDGRAVERALRQTIYVAAHFASDNVVECEWVVRKMIHSTGWGLEPRRAPSPDGRGAFGFAPVIETAHDLRKLRVPQIAHDDGATQEQVEFFQSLFGDILSVRLKGVCELSYHLMNQYTALRGLEQVMVDMIERPQMVHDAMSFLEEGHRQILRQYIAQDLLSLNNDNTPIYTSGHGYTDELPPSGREHGHVLPEDLWCWAEAQEMAVVSPAMHREFVFPYEKRLLQPFGLNGYGCCDDVTRKLDFVLTIPRLRRVSVSPWADVERCAEQIGQKAIMMWKPNPAHLVGEFDAAAIDGYLRRAIAAARTNGCTLEIVLLDTHTCELHPERFDAWSRIAQSAASAWSDCPGSA
jgi:hypothetical protein